MDDDLPVVVNEHSRRFPRSLRDAFPVSENYRASIEGPEDDTVEKVVDLICWGIVFALFAWIGWQAWKAPKVPW